MLLCAALPSAVSAQQERAGTTLYFFSPETSVNNYYVLKNEFETYFASHGGLRFQPFSNRADFESMLTERTPGLFLMSSWHFKNLDDRAGLIPVLVGVLDNQTSQRHGLYVASEISDLSGLQHHTIATAGSPEYTLSLLHEMLGDEEEYLVSSLRLLVVPKHMDALMAVSFGVAQGALAAEAAAERLSQINPKQRSAFSVLAQTEPLMLPVIVIPSSENDTEIEALGSLLDMDGITEGRRCLRLLGLDGFEELVSGEQKTLLE